MPHEGDAARETQVVLSFVFALALALALAPGEDLGTCILATATFSVVGYCEQRRRQNIASWFNDSMKASPSDVLRTAVWGR